MTNRIHILIKYNDNIGLDIFKMVYYNHPKYQSEKHALLVAASKKRMDEFVQLIKSLLVIPPKDDIWIQHNQFMLTSSEVVSLFDKDFYPPKMVNGFKFGLYHQDFNDETLQNIINQNENIFQEMCEEYKKQKENNVQGVIDISPEEIVTHAMLNNTLNNLLNQNQGVQNLPPANTTTWTVPVNPQPQFPQQQIHEQQIQQQPMQMQPQQQQRLTMTEASIQIILQEQQFEVYQLRQQQYQLPELQQMLQKHLSKQQELLKIIPLQQAQWLLENQIYLTQLQLQQLPKEMQQQIPKIRQHQPQLQQLQNRLTMTEASIQMFLQKQQFAVYQLRQQQYQLPQLQQLLEKQLLKQQELLKEVPSQQAQWLLENQIYLTQLQLQHLSQQMQQQQIYQQPIPQIPQPQPQPLQQLQPLPLAINIPVEKNEKEIATKNKEAIFQPKGYFIASENRNTPDDHPSLKILYDYIKKIEAFKNEFKITEDQCNDAVIVIHCLMFLKINGPFLVYAYQYQNDKDKFVNIFMNETDRKYKTIRDHCETAIHLAPDYTDGQAFAATMIKLAEQMETVINIASQKNKLLELTLYFRPDVATGCIDAWTRPVIDFGIKLNEYSYIPSLRDLFHTISESLNAKDVYAAAYEKLKTHMHKPYSYPGKDEVIYLTKQYIDRYLEEFITLKKKPEIKRNAAEVLQLIENGDALIKTMLRSKIQFYIPQWLDPAHERFVLELSPFANRSKTFHMNEHTWKTKLILKKRGLPKEGTIWPKKWSHFLLSKDANMILYSFLNRDIKDFQFHLINDVHLANLKGEKYLSPGMFESQERPWIDNNYYDNRFIQTRSAATSLENLKQTCNQPITPGRLRPTNEVLACTPIEALRAIACSGTSEISYHSRLELWAVQSLFKDLFGITLPMLGIAYPDNNDAKISIYDEDLQVSDALNYQQSEEGLLWEISYFNNLKKIDNITEKDFFNCFIQNKMLSHALILATRWASIDENQCKMLLELCYEHIDEIKNNQYFKKFVNKYSNFLIAPQQLQMLNSIFTDAAKKCYFGVQIISVLDCNIHAEVVTKLCQFCTEIYVDNKLKLKENLFDLLIAMAKIAFEILTNKEKNPHTYEQNKLIFASIYHFLQAVNKDLLRKIESKMIYKLLTLIVDLVIYSIQNNLSICLNDIEKNTNNIMKRGISLLEQIENTTIKNDPAFIDNNFATLINLNIQSIFFSAIFGSRVLFLAELDKTKQRVSACALEDRLDRIYYVSGFNFTLSKKFEEAYYCFSLLQNKFTQGIPLALNVRNNIQVLEKFIDVYIACCKQLFTGEKLINCLEFACEFINKNSLNCNDDFLQYKQDLIKLYKDNNQLPLSAKMAFDCLSNANGYSSLLLVKDNLEALKCLEFPYLIKMPKICKSLLEKLNEQINNSEEIDKIIPLCQQITSIYQYLSHCFSPHSLVKEFFNLVVDCLQKETNEKTSTTDLMVNLVQLHNTFKLMHKNIKCKYVNPFFIYLNLLNTKKIEYNSFLKSLNELNQQEWLHSLLKIPQPTARNDAQNLQPVYQTTQAVTLFNPNKRKHEENINDSAKKYKPSNDEYRRDPENTARPKQ